MRRLLALLLILCGAAAWAAAFPLTWPVPQGFKSETIPFPLDFAPQLRYSGIEELRFTPGFRDPQAPDYFTYCFVWLLDKPVRLDLKHDLTAYFDGLMNAVAEEKNEPTHVVGTTAEVKPASGGWTATVYTWDAFFTRQPLRLELNVREVPCPLRDRQAFYFEVSPHLAAIEDELMPLRRAAAAFK